MSSSSRRGPGVTSRPLRLVDDHAVDDIRVAHVACAAIETIRSGLRRGDDPTATVVRVLITAFSIGDSGEEIDRLPGGGPCTTNGSQL